MFAVFVLSCSSALFAGGLNKAAAGQKGDKEWSTFVNSIDKSNTEFAKGRVGYSTNEIWSHGDETTLFGG
jgi:hypothetical protein